MKNGWIKLHRKVLDNQAFKHDKNAMFVFMVLLLMADKETGKFECGRYQLADLCGMKDSTVYKILKRLSSNSMVNTKSNNKYTVISICNWRKYQAPSNNQVTTPVTTKSQPSNNEVTLNNNIIIENKEINTTSVVFGKPEVNEIFEYWYEATGIPLTSQVKANRYAAATLVKQHGSEKLRRLIDGVVLAQSDRYAPRISNFVQLRAKVPDLLVWGKQQSRSKGVRIS